MGKFDLSLIQLRKLVDVTQGDIAVALQTSQANVARIEKEITERLNRARIENLDFGMRDIVSHSQRIAWLGRCGHYVTDMSRFLQLLSSFEPPAGWDMCISCERILFPLRHPVSCKPVILVCGNSTQDWGLQTLVTRRLCAGNPPEGSFPFVPDKLGVVIWKHTAERPIGIRLPIAFAGDSFSIDRFRRRAVEDFIPAPELMRPAAGIGETVVFSDSPLLRYFDVIQVPVPTSRQHIFDALALASLADLCIIATSDHKPSDLVRSLSVVHGRIGAVFLKDGVTSKGFFPGTHEHFWFTDVLSLEDDDEACSRLFSLIEPIASKFFAQLKERVISAEIPPRPYTRWITEFNDEVSHKAKLHDSIDYRDRVVLKDILALTQYLNGDTSNTGEIIFDEKKDDLFVHSEPDGFQEVLALVEVANRLR